MPANSETILVAGATGRFGSLVVPALKARGLRVRALARNTRKAEAVLNAGADESVLGDLRDLPSLTAAARDVSGVFYIGPGLMADQAEMGLNMVQAARLAGVRRFVYSSAIRPLDNPQAKIAVENAVYESGLQYTVLRPAHFMQNLNELWLTVRQTGVLAEPFEAAARVARVDYRDVADVAAIALASDRLAHATLELCSEGAYNRHDIAAMMSQFMGSTVRAEMQSIQHWALQARPDYDAGQLEQLQNVFDYFSRQGLNGNALTLRAVLGREPRSLRDYVAELAGVARPARPRRKPVAPVRGPVRPSSASWVDIS